MSDVEQLLPITDSPDNQSGASLPLPDSFVVPAEQETALTSQDIKGAAVPVTRRKVIGWLAAAAAAGVSAFTAVEAKQMYDISAAEKLQKKPAPVVSSSLYPSSDADPREHATPTPTPSPETAEMLIHPFTPTHLWIKNASGQEVVNTVVVAKPAKKAQNNHLSGAAAEELRLAYPEPDGTDQDPTDGHFYPEITYVTLWQDENSFKLGSEGVAVMLGHNSSDMSLPAVFRPLVDAKPGDLVIMSGFDESGNQITAQFKILGHEIADKNNESALQETIENKQPEGSRGAFVLCDGVSDGNGLNQNRVVFFGDMQLA